MSEHEAEPQKAETTHNISTKEQPSPFDGFESAKPGEPVFTLQGGDPFAPDLVLTWARQARELGLSLEEEDPGRALKLKLKASAAEEMAWAMEEYLKGWGSIEETVSISGDVVARKLDKWDARTRAARQLSFADANLKEQYDLLKRFADELPEDFSNAFAAISEARRLLINARKIIEIKRGEQ